MARGVTTIDQYFAAKRTRDWDKVYKASKVEAARMLTELQKWAEWQERYDPEGMLDEYTDARIFDKIEETRLAVGRIREKNRKHGKLELARNMEWQKYLKASEGKDLTPEQQDELKAPWRASVEEINALEDEQFGLIGRVTRNYCQIAGVIMTLGGGNPNLSPEEVDPFAEYEYDL
jgi:hypothetical protein